MGAGDIRIISEDKGRVWIDDITVTEQGAETFRSTAESATINSPPRGRDNPASHSTARGPAIPGALWRGRSWDGRDFVMSDPAIAEDGTIRYRYAATREAGDLPITGTINGIVDVTFLGRHMKAMLTIGGGDARHESVIDATFIPDGRYAYAVGTIADGDSRVPWWATLDTTASVSVPERINLNKVSVSELEAVGLSARNARSVVEGRIFWGRYRSVNEALSAPGLSSREQDLLRRKSDVR